MPEDLASFYAAHPGHEVHQTVTALVGVLGDEVIAVGGVAHVNGILVAFLDLDDKARRYKVAMVKAGKKLMARLNGKVVVAQADPKETGAPRWLESMGFKRMNETGFYRLFES